MRLHIIGLLTLFILIAGPVCAHRPLFVEMDNTHLEQPVIIPDPKISWAVYADLEPMKVHYYEFEIPSGGLNFFGQLLVSCSTPVPGLSANSGPDWARFALG